jgi:hypothetical protein
MRVFRSIVQSSPSSVFDSWHQLIVRRGVTRELVGHNGSRAVLQSLKELSEEPLGRFGVAALLHQDVEYFAVLVDGTPQIDLLAIDLAENVVQIPSIPDVPLRVAEFGVRARYRT